MVMGGQKVTTQRPRVRSKDGAELQLPTLGLFQNEDPRIERYFSRLLSGVSTRKYARTVDEPTERVVCEQERSQPPVREGDGIADG